MLRSTISSTSGIWDSASTSKRSVMEDVVLVAIPGEGLGARRGTRFLGTSRFAVLDSSGRITEVISTMLRFVREVVIKGQRSNNEHEVVALSLR